jgi:hypothetical protein
MFVRREFREMMIPVGESLASLSMWRTRGRNAWTDECRNEREIPTALCRRCKADAVRSRSARTSDES